MNWHICKIVFQIICGHGDHTPQFEEQWRLIMAANEDEALIKADNIGSIEEQSFYNDRRQLVQWKFMEVTELYNLSDMADGTEIFSRIEESDYPESYLALQRRRGTLLQHTQSKVNSANF